jgi:hypothetical protein
MLPDPHFPIIRNSSFDRVRTGKSLDDSLSNMLDADRGRLFVNLDEEICVLQPWYFGWIQKNQFVPFDIIND